MFEEFLKSDEIFSASDKQPNNSKFNITTPATATATVTDIQMDDISNPTIETTPTETKPSNPPHVWEQIRLNLDEDFHCV